MTGAETQRSKQNRTLLAYTLPMLLFVLLLPLASMLKSPTGSLWRVTPAFWVYPLQTVLCSALLFYFWDSYRFGSLSKPLFVLLLGLFVFVVWIAPQQWLGLSPRTIGFNPDLLANQPTLYWITVVLRFLRLVIVVPLVEEIFWRGFLLRYLIAERFETVAFGLSFGVVTLAFCFSHSRPDWLAALVTGALYNFVAYRTKSLTSCVLAHALTNLALGLWIMATKQWGFW